MSGQTKSGKGKKKSNNVLMSLEEFVATPEVPSRQDWGEIMRKHEAEQGPNQSAKEIILPTKPLSQRGPSIPRDELPEKGPFKAVITGLSINANHDDLFKFFKDCGVVNIEEVGKLNHIEFETADGLYEALSKNGQLIKGRAIEVHLEQRFQSQNSRNNRYGGFGERGSMMGRSDGRGDRQGGAFRSNMGSRMNEAAGMRSTDEPDNWRQAPRAATTLPPPAPSTLAAPLRQPYISRHSFDPDQRRSVGAGSNYHHQRYEGRNSYPAGSSDRDFANVRNEPRPLPISHDQRHQDVRQVDRHNRHSERHEREEVFSRNPREVSASARRSNSPTNSQQSSSSWRPVAGPGKTVNRPLPSASDHYHPATTVTQFNRQDIEQSRTTAVPQAQERPKIAAKAILQIVAGSDDNAGANGQQTPAARSAAAPTRNPSIFGDAKPVDTFKRELEIAEKLKQQQQLQSLENQLQASNRSRCVSGTSEAGSNHNSVVAKNDDAVAPPVDQP